MEEEIINIATLTIDSEKAVGTIEQTKKAIFDLQKSNSELRKDIQKNGDVTGEQTKQFVEQEAKIKNLNAVYKSQQSAINELTLSQLKETSSLKDSVKSIAQAEAQNKELLEIKKQINITTDEGRQAMELLNQKMDENTKFIKANDNEDQKRQSNIGKYPSLMAQAGGAFGGFQQNVEQARTIVGGFGKTVNDVSDALTNQTKSVITSTRTMIGFGASNVTATEAQVAQTTASEAQAAATGGVTAANTAASGSFKILKLAIIGTGIGALVILLVSVYTAISQSESASNKFSKALSGFKGILNAVFSVLRPLGEFLIDKIVAGFELAGQAAEKALGLISKGLSFIGLEKAGKAVSNFTENVKGTIQATQQLDAAEKKLQASQRYSQKIQLDYQKQAEKLRQLRDDESRGVAQRMKDNEALGNVFKKQSAEELKIANQGVAISNLRIKLTGKSKDNLNELAEAQTKVSDIQERISGQESEQLANLNSLRKEANDKAKELAQQEKDRKLKSLSDSVLVFESEKHSVEEQLAFYQKYYEKLNTLQNGSDRIKNAQDFSAKILEISKQQIDGEVEAQKKLIEEKKNISAQEQKDLLANAEFLKQSETQRIQNSLLSEKDKSVAMEEIQKGYLENVAIINKEFEDSEKARKEEQTALDALDFEMRLLDIEEQGYSESELKLRILQEEHAERLRLISVQLDEEGKLTKKAQKEIEVENKKFDKAKKVITKEEVKTKRAAQFQIVQDAIAAAQAIFGESKALAIASALINTYQGITAELSTKAVTPYEIGLKVANVALVAASGFASVKNILKTNKGSSDTGSGSAGGTTAGTQTFENPAKTNIIAQVQTPPPSDQQNQVQTVLVLETLDEAKNNQQIKIKSN